MFFRLRARASPALRPSFFKSGLTDILLEGVPPRATFRQWTDGGHLDVPILCIPSDQSLIDYYNGEEWYADCLKDGLEHLQNDFDYILIDSPPGIDRLTKCIMYASQRILLVFDSTAASLPGIKTTVFAAERWKADDRDFKVIATKFSSRYPLVRQSLKECIAEGFEVIGEPVWETVEFGRAAQNYQSIFSFARYKDHNRQTKGFETTRRAANAIDAIAKQIVGSCEQTEPPELTSVNGHWSIEVKLDFVVSWA